MLIEITRKCNERCSHCMVNATPDGDHMEFNTLQKCIKFAIENDVKVINISGGDPFLHPQIFKWIRYIIDETRKLPIIIGIQSNGWWIEDKTMCKRIKSMLNNSKVALMQISTHKKYYPNYEWTMGHKSDYESLSDKIKFESNWQGDVTHLSYMGRAQDLMKLEDIKGYHHCINILQYAMVIGLDKFHRNPLRDTINLSISRNHSCIPYIDVQGHIKLGEGINCTPIFNINNYNNKSDSDKIFNKILSFIPCNRCKCSKNYSDNQKDQLNKMRLMLNLKPIFNEQD